MKILHIFRSPMGGLFRHVLDVARGQIALGHEVGIVCDATPGGERAEDSLATIRPQLALGLTRLPMHRLPHPSDARIVAGLTRLQRRIAADVLHGHGAKGGAYARTIVEPRRAGAIRVYTPHGGAFHYAPGSLSHAAYMRIETMLGRRTDLFLFESDYVRDRFARFVGPTDRVVRVVHNGVTDAEFEPIERLPDPFDLVYIGELRMAKGVDTLIDALAIVRREHKIRLTLLAVGAGPSEEEFKARARAAGVWDSIAFVPPQPIRSALARGRIMILPSRAESLPYVVLEAVAAAQPLVSTNVGGIPEIFGPYADELIRADDPTALAARILSSFAEPEGRRESRAFAVRRHVRETFRVDRMVTDGLAAYGAARRRRDEAA